MPLFGSPLLLLRTCYPTSLLCQTALSSCWILSEFSFRCIWCLGCLTRLTQELLTSFHKHTQDTHVPWATQMHAVNTVKSNLYTEINKIIKSQHWTLKYLHSLYTLPTHRHRRRTPDLCRDCQVQLSLLDVTFSAPCALFITSSSQRSWVRQCHTQTPAFHS